MTDPKEGDVYRHPSAGEEVIIDYVTDAEVYLRVTDGAGGLIRACRVPRTSWRAIREVHGLELTNREETPPMTDPTIPAEPEPCEYCGATDWSITATLIGCHGCGVVYGRVNGAWVLDPDTVPGSVRRLDIGRGFVRARECPDCFHTKCGESCVCNCDAAHAEAEAAHLRGKVENLESLTTWRPISEPPSAEVHAWCGGHYLIRYPDGAWRVVQFSTVRALVAFAKRYIGGERFRWLPIPPADESEGE